VGTISNLQTVTLTNSGTASLTITAITASPSAFAIALPNTPGATACQLLLGSTLAAGSSCRIPVTFTPSTTGSITGTLTIDDNAPGSPQTVSLSGTGIPPAPTLASITPNNGAVGSTVNVTLTGVNFVPGAMVNVSNSGVGVSNVDVVSVTQITATFAIASTAAYGPVSVTVTTAGGTGGPVSFTIVPPISLTGLTATTVPTQATSVGVALNSAATAQLTGTLTLSFTPDPKVTNVPSGYSDPAMQFAAGGTTMSFSIPAGATTASLLQNGAIQQGTVAGTITVTLTQLSAGGTSMLPQPAPFATVKVPLIAPVITSGSVTITNLTSTGFDVQLDAYSTSRDLQSATISFQAASGTQLNGTTSFSVPLSSIAPGWFSGATGLQNGSSFQLTVPFTFSGDTSVFGPNSVSVTLTNSVGSSSAVTGGV
jgi:hypothetical protein